MRIRIPFLYGLLFFGLLNFSMQAQQDSQYAQYLINTMTINPAYAGAQGRLTVLGLYRNQWTGMEGAPKTLNLSVDSPIGFTGRMGTGVEFTKDQIGPSDQSVFAANFSYILPVSRTLHFDFGIKAGIQSLRIDEERLNIYDYHNLDMDFRNRIMPMIGAGAYLYGSQWYIAVSTPNFLESRFYDDVKVSVLAERMHLYFMGGYTFALSDYFLLKPAFLAKAVRGAPVGLDFSLNTVIYDRFAAGVSYRTSSSIGALIGFQINDYFMLGYAYDYSTTDLARYNNGSHEVFLRFQLAPKRQWESIRLKTVF